MNQEEISKLAKSIIEAIGEDTSREGLLETPERVARSFTKLYGGYQQNPADIMTIFDSEGYDEMIICKDIDFYSTCEHHMQPFFGKVHIGYIPNDKIVGLSKLPRLVEVFSRRLQNQERMTVQIGEALTELIGPEGVGVVVEGKHLCMMSRGVEKQNASMTTSYNSGSFRKDLNTRSEFLRLIK